MIVVRKAWKSERFTVGWDIHIIILLVVVGVVVVIDYNLVFLLLVASIFGLLLSTLVRRSQIESLFVAVGGCCC